MCAQGKVVRVGKRLLSALFPVGPDLVQSHVIASSEDPSHLPPTHFPNWSFWGGGGGGGGCSLPLPFPPNPSPLSPSPPPPPPPPPLSVGYSFSGAAAPCS